MKRAIFFIILLAVSAGCSGQREAEEYDFITFDFTKINSPKKELILQDFMDVEYISLETNDDFLNDGFVADIGKTIILVKNAREGDIFVYDRTGKAFSKINRKGRGNEEYLSLRDITLDEDNDEIYVNDSFGRKIMVYDLYGKFKRSLQYKEGVGTVYSEIFNYDKDNLICLYEVYEGEDNLFMLISKQDGSITKEIKIPYKEKKVLDQRLVGETITIVSPSGPFRRITPFKGNWILFEFSSDTLYTLLPDYSLRPFLVRTPSIQSMNPEVFLLLRLFSDRYYFMETIINVYDFATRKGFPQSFMMYDKKEKAMFRYAVYNGDYLTKKEIYMNRLEPGNHEIESWQPLAADQLVASHKKGELKGKLKEIAAKLKEDDNPVIMLIKHKK